MYFYMMNMLTQTVEYAKTYFAMAVYVLQESYSNMA